MQASTGGRRATRVVHRGGERALGAGVDDVPRLAFEALRPLPLTAHRRRCLTAARRVDRTTMSECRRRLRS